MSTAPEERAFDISRRVDAPVERVFRAFTEVDDLEGWWGPEGYSVASVTSDARPGGEFGLVMVGPDEPGRRVEGAYREVSPPTRLVTEISGLGEDGAPVLTAVLTIELRDHAGGTEIRLGARGRALAPEAHGMLAGMQSGWTESLACLERYLQEREGPSLKMLHDTA